jgi:hypothetical protein
MIKKKRHIKRLKQLKSPKNKNKEKIGKKEMGENLEEKENEGFLQNITTR